MDDKAIGEGGANHAPVPVMDGTNLKISLNCSGTNRTLCAENVRRIGLYSRSGPPNFSPNNTLMTPSSCLTQLSKTASSPTPKGKKPSPPTSRHSSNR